MAQIRSLNRVILAGRVFKKPEITYLPKNGRELAKMTIVTNEGYYDQNKEWKEKPEWHNITAWGPIARKIEKSIGKGDMVLVEGKIKSRTWTDKNGVNRRLVDIVADSVVALVKSSRETGQVESAPITKTVSENGLYEPYSEQEPPFEEATGGDDFSSSEEDPF